MPGEYTLRLDAKSFAFNVQRTPDESDLKPLSEADLKQLRANHLAINAPLNAPTTAKTQPPRHPLERVLLATLPFLLLGEMLLAGWSTHRRNLRVNPISMETP